MKKGSIQTIILVIVIIITITLLANAALAEQPARSVGRYNTPEPTPRWTPTSIPTPYVRPTIQPIVPSPTPTATETPTPTIGIPLLPRPTATPDMCKLVVIGDTPEVFPADADVRSGDESTLLAEAHGYLEMTLGIGENVKVLFWSESLGHSGPIVDVFCDRGLVVVIEPLMPQ